MAGSEDEVSVEDSAEVTTELSDEELLAGSEDEEYFDDELPIDDLMAEEAESSINFEKDSDDEEFLAGSEDEVSVEDSAEVSAELSDEEFNTEEGAIDDELPVEEAPDEVLTEQQPEEETVAEIATEEQVEEEEVNPLDELDMSMDIFDEDRDIYDSQLNKSVKS